MRRRSGISLMDLLMTISLVTIVLTMSSMLPARVWKTERRSVEMDRFSRGQDQMLAILNRDVAGAKSLTVEPAKLTIENVTWEISPEKMERTDASGKRFWVLPCKHDILFEKSSYGVALKTPDSRVPLLNQLTWAKEALK